MLFDYAILKSQLKHTEDYAKYSNFMYVLALFGGLAYLIVELSRHCMSRCASFSLNN